MPKFMTTCKFLLAILTAMLMCCTTAQVTQGGKTVLKCAEKFPTSALQATTDLIVATYTKWGDWTAFMTELESWAERTRDSEFAVCIIDNIRNQMSPPVEISVAKLSEPNRREELRQLLEKVRKSRLPNTELQ